MRKKKVAMKTLFLKLQRFLYKHKAELFKKQHRDAKKKAHFDLCGSFQIGLGSTQVGNLQFVGTTASGHIRHNFKNTAAFVRPVSQQDKPVLWKEAYKRAMRILRRIDPAYAAGETIVQFAHMNSPDHYVREHVDRDDISFQYALSLGRYEGATLRAIDAGGKAHDIDNRWKVAKFDGRLRHEVQIDHSFSGDRFTIIWYKHYDSHKEIPDPILPVPTVAWPMVQV